MVWSHLHPAVIHFAVGVGLLYFLWDLSQLTKKSSEALPGERFFGEVAVGLFLLLLGTALLGERLVFIQGAGLSGVQF